MTATFSKSASLTLAGLAAGSAPIAFAPSAPAQPAAGQSTASAAQCEALAGQTIGGATVKKAGYLAKGSATISPLVKAVHDVCHVSARTNPVAGSEIHLRIWLS